MVRLSCPLEGCKWLSQDLDAAFAEVLNTALVMHDYHVHCKVDSNPAKLTMPIVGHADQVANKPVKLTMPMIRLGSNLDQWSAFERQWQMFRNGVAVSNEARPGYLLFGCCVSEMQKDLLNAGVSTVSEPELLAAMKRLALADEMNIEYFPDTDEKEVPASSNSYIVTEKNKQNAVDSPSKQQSEKKIGCKQPTSAINLEFLNDGSPQVCYAEIF